MKWSMCFILVLSATSILPAQPAALDQIRRDYADQKYQAVVTRISSTLADSGATLTPAQRYELFFTRGECLVQLGQMQYASRDFLDAARLAPDRDKAIEARANVAITKRSAASGYRPRRDANNPMPIKTSEQRRKAMAVAFDDLLTENKARIDTVLRADNLLPLRNLMQTLYDLYALEIMTTGKSEQLDPMFDAMGEKAIEVVTKGSARLSDRTEHLHGRASRLRVSESGYAATVNYGGLSSNDRRELRGVIEDLEQMQSVSQIAVTIARDFGRTGQRWLSMTEQVNGILQLARETAAIDYTED